MTNKVDCNKIGFVRFAGGKRITSDTLAGAFADWKNDKEKFLFISPHDDDVILGAGLLIQLAIRKKIPVYILIATDGSMGYCSQEQKADISKIRQQETYNCYKSLGVPEQNIIWLGYPDCQLNYYRGRRFSDSDANEQTAVNGSIGLQNTFTYWLRKIAPTQCFIPTSSDLHPDHKIIHEEFLISLFHSAGDIWPELGQPVGIPAVYEMGVYCDFPEPPTLRIQTPELYLENKLKAIAAFESQRQISSLIEIVRKSGAYEYLRQLAFKLYQPTEYYNSFE